MFPSMAKDQHGDGLRKTILPPDSLRLVLLCRRSCGRHLVPISSRAQPGNNFAYLAGIRAEADACRLSAGHPDFTRTALPLFALLGGRGEELIRGQVERAELVAGDSRNAGLSRTVPDAASRPRLAPAVHS